MSRLIINPLLHRFLLRIGDGELLGFNLNVRRTCRHWIRIWLWWMHLSVRGLGDDWSILYMLPVGISRVVNGPITNIILGFIKFWLLLLLVNNWRDAVFFSQYFLRLNICSLLYNISHQIWCGIFKNGEGLQLLVAKALIFSDFLLFWMVKNSYQELFLLVFVQLLFILWKKLN